MGDQEGRREEGDDDDDTILPFLNFSPFVNCKSHEGPCPVKNVSKTITKYFEFCFYPTNR